MIDGVTVRLPLRNGRSGDKEGHSGYRGHDHYRRAIACLNFLNHFPPAAVLMGGELPLKTRQKPGFSRNRLSPTPGAGEGMSVRPNDQITGFISCPKRPATAGEGLFPKTGPEAFVIFVRCVEQPMISGLVLLSGCAFGTLEQVVE